MNYIKRFCFRSKKGLTDRYAYLYEVFCQPKVTEQYPENRHTTLHIPERHRAQLVMPHDDENHHHCIACGLCQMACPNGTIKVISEMREDEEGKKKKVLVKYEYNLGSCMFLRVMCKRMSAWSHQVQQRFRKCCIRKRKAPAHTKP